MRETNIEERVRRLISDRLDRKAAEVMPQARLVDDLGADPVELAELSMALQEEFNIFLDDGACRLNTVAEVIDCVKSKLYE